LAWLAKMGQLAVMNAPLVNLQPRKKHRNAFPAPVLDLFTPPPRQLVLIAQRLR